MIARHKILPWILLFACCQNVLSGDIEEPKDDLMESESKDPSKVEIVKQIKRVNSDGSYTFGYEAEDGTFKIESRDVLGNVKGTFGFVDHDGEIKRVTYSSNNGTDTSTLSSVDKDRSPVVQSIPRSNRTSSTTRRPTIVFPQVTASPSNTVIQTIPRRRILSSTNATTTTERPIFKHITKAIEYDATPSRSQSATEPTPRALSSSQHQRTVYQNGHFIRSTLSPQVDVQRYTEGQLVRPTNSDTVTARPNDGAFLRRYIVTRNPLLDDQISSTIKPITEETDSDDIIRGNILRRQLNQEKVNSYDARQHVLNLHQSIGDDAQDVHSASLTTGTPRPLFTTTIRPRISPSPTVTTQKGTISPAKYPAVFQKNSIRGPRPFLDGYNQESTTDSSNIAEANYVTPNSIPVLQIPQDENGIPLLHGRPLPRGAILIPVHQVQNRYVYEDPNRIADQQHYSQAYSSPHDPYLREANRQGYIHPSHLQNARGTPVPIVLSRRRLPEEDPREYQKMEIMQEYTQRPYPLLPNPINLQDDVDNIKPPVSTIDFQKLLNRLILRQNNLKEINRLESLRMIQDDYYNPSYERYRNGQQQTDPVSIFVRSRQDTRQDNGPIQFIPAHQSQRQRSFVAIPQSQGHLTQSRMESQQQYHAADPYNQNYDQVPLYRTGRRVSRLLGQGSRPKEDDDNYLPPDVREMLLLKMLQLAINPNLPIPPSEQELMTTANPPHRKEAVRNVQILGEEREDDKGNVRNKRYQRPDDETMEYY